MPLTADDQGFELASALRARGQRVTSQRLVMYVALRDLGRHVSAEEVFKSVADRLPGTSLPTVYATLELFEELGIVRRVGFAGGTVLYDPRLDDHHHSVCRSCGRVEDLDAELESSSAIEAARAEGFEATHASLVVSGLCRSCREEPDRRSARPS